MTKMFVDPQARMTPITSYVLGNNATWLQLSQNTASVVGAITGGNPLYPRAGNAVSVRSENGGNLDYLLFMAAAGTGSPTTSQNSRASLEQEVYSINELTNPNYPMEVIIGARVRRSAGRSAPLASVFYGSANLLYGPNTSETDVYVEVCFNIVTRKIQMYYNSELVMESTLTIASGATVVILYVGSNPTSNGNNSAIANGETMNISSIVGIQNKTAGDMERLGPVSCQRIPASASPISNPVGDWADPSAVVSSLTKTFENTTTGLTPLVSPATLNTSPTGGTVDCALPALPAGYELIGFATTTSAQRANPASPVNLAVSTLLDGALVGDVVKASIKSPTTHVQPNVVLLSKPIKSGDVYPTKYTVKFVSSK